MPRFATSALLVPLLGVFFSWTLPVQAEDAEVEAGGDGDVRVEARGRFDRGVELFNLGDHEAALAEFTRAYELLPAYVVLFNIGQAQASLGDYPAAVAAYERFLSDGADAVDAEQRDRVERLLETLRSRIGRIDVSVEGGVEAMILLGGAEIGRAPFDEPLVVRSGSHTIEARADGYLSSIRDVTVAGGETVHVELELDSALRAPGGIQVEVNVIGVTVTLDGEMVGTTPLDETISTQPGPHVIEVTRRGYDELRREVDVVVGQVTPARFALRPSDPIPAEVAGNLEVEVSEDDAEVLLDGHLFRNGPVPVGTHRLEVRSDGFERWSELVEVDLSPLTPVVATLTPGRTLRERQHTRARRIHAGAYAALGTAVASLAVAAGLFVWNGSRYDQWESTNVEIRRNYSGVSADGEGVFDLTAPGVVARLWDDTVENNELIDSIQTIGSVSWAFIGVGCAAALAAILMLVLGPSPAREREARPASTLIAGPGGGAVRVVW